MFAMDYQFLSDIGGSCLGLVFFFFFSFPHQEKLREG